MALALRFAASIVIIIIVVAALRIARLRRVALVCHSGYPVILRDRGMRRQYGRRHRPEETQLYRLVEQYYPAFVEHLAEQGMSLPAIPPNPRSGR